MGHRRGAHMWCLVGRPEGKRALGRIRHIWEDDIKIDLQEMGWGALTGLLWPSIGTGVGHL
jgi:hypothetical protein